MSAKLSTEITHCVRDGRRLLSAFETEGPHVASAFLDTTEPHQADGDDEARPGGFLVAVTRKIRAALDHLVKTDFAVTHAAARESVLRARRKEDKRQLAFVIVALRRLVQAQFIDPDLDNLGLQPVNVRDSMTILRRAVLIGERFEAVNLAAMLGKSRFASPVDLGPHVAEIREKSAELLALTEEINEAQRVTDRARIERDRAKKDYERVYLRGARMFEDLCRFAGLDELAETVRRRKRRPAKASEPASEDRSAPAHDDGTAAQPQGHQPLMQVVVDDQTHDLDPGEAQAMLSPVGSAVGSDETGSCQPPADSVGLQPERPGAKELLACYVDRVRPLGRPVTKRPKATSLGVTS